MFTVTISNQKGGAGKTTLCHVLATGLSDKGFRVLAIDTDPQTNFTYTAGLETSSKPDLYAVLKGEAQAADAIEHAAAGFDMIPGSMKFSGADMEFKDNEALKKALQPLKDNYDFCLIDTAPSLGILAINALAASNTVIIPMAADIYSLQGLSQLWQLIENVRAFCNPHLKVDGLLLTRYNPRAIINREIKKSMEGIAHTLNTKVYNASIREAVAIKEMQFNQGNLFKDYPKANVTRDYEAFITEFLERE